MLLALQDYVETMKAALQKGQEESPLKATIESVLPGVHDHFVNLHHEINRVRKSVDSLVDEEKGRMTGNFFLFEFDL